MTKNRAAENSAQEASAHIDQLEGDVNLTDARGNWQDDGASRAGRDWLARDAAAFFHQALSTPCLDTIVEAQGPYLIDADGRRLLDFHGNASHLLGFRHPAVVRAVQRQIETLPFCTRRFTNPSAVALAERLIELAPLELKNNARVLFAPGGSEVVSIALRLARAVTGRYKTVAFYGGFHGGALDTSSLGGSRLFTRGMGPLLPGVIHVPPPSEFETARQCAEHIDFVLEEEGDVAALIAEPIRATTLKHPPAEFWRQVRAACDQHGTLLIFDEIPTGLGRSGHLWASEAVGVSPDILAIGKSLGGGMLPQAAMLARADFNDSCHVPIGELSIGHFTHEKSPLGTAAGLATLNTIVEQELPQRARQFGGAWREELARELGEFDCVAAVRNTGLMLAIELSGADAEGLADRTMYESLKRGLSFKLGGGTCLLMFPPLIVEEEQLREATGILREAIAAARN